MADNKHQVQKDKGQCLENVGEFGFFGESFQKPTDDQAYDEWKKIVCQLQKV